MNSIYNQFLQEPRFRPSAIAAQRVAAGLYGRKSGAGFYDYRNPPAAKVETARKTCDVPVWISNAEPALARALRSMLADAGVTLDTSDKPRDQLAHSGDTAGLGCNDRRDHAAARSDAHGGR